jgi:hypothetical protein
MMTTIAATMYNAQEQRDVIKNTANVAYNMASQAQDGVDDHDSQLLKTRKWIHDVEEQQKEDSAATAATAARLAKLEDTRVAKLEAVVEKLVADNIQFSDNMNKLSADNTKLSALCAAMDAVIQRHPDSAAVSLFPQSRDDLVYGTRAYSIVAQIQRQVHETLANKAAQGQEA